MVGAQSRRIIATDRFNNSLEEAARYIRQHSPANADKLMEGAWPKIKQIAKSPFASPVEQQIPDSTVEYRFSIYMKSFKIIFRVLDDAVLLIDFVHVARGPDYYRQLRTTDYT